jgi:penicillin-binding protein 2
MAKRNPLESGTSFEKKVTFFGLVLYIAVGILFLRIFYLQVIKGSYYLQRSKDNKEQHIYIPADRGEIFDRNFDPESRSNNILVRNQNSMDIYLVPGNLTTAEILSSATNYSRIMGIPASNIVVKLSNVMKQRYYTRYQPVLLSKGISQGQLIRIAENNTILPGIFWQNNPYRVYPNGSLASHLLGYVGIINKKELEDYAMDPDYHPGSVLGKSGLEKYYDKELRGKDGEMIRIVDAHNRIKNTILASEPVPGNRFVLNIDKRIQKICDTVIKNDVGCIIISDPETGEILGMSSFPTFDPNIFIGEIDSKEYRRLVEDRQFPFLNRPVAAKYPPSSTFKIITLAAALNEEIADSSTRYLCKGLYKFEGDDRVFRCWGIHGWTDTEKSLAVSCDIYYYNVGYLLGSEKIARYSRDFGLGEVTGIDLPGESSGFIPSHAWKRKVFREAWYDGDTLNMSIGQGFLLVTPLQMLNVVSAIATGGVIYKPMVVNRILNSANNQPIRIFTPKIHRNISISQKNLNIIRNGMQKVMSYGTAFLTGRNMRIKVYGKTGTAQVTKGDPHAWFIGYAKDDKTGKLYAVCVFVEHGKGGGERAAPIAVAALQAIILNQDAKELKQQFTGRIIDYYDEIRQQRRQEDQSGPKPLQDIQF